MDASRTASRAELPLFPSDSPASTSPTARPSTGGGPLATSSSAAAAPSSAASASISPAASPAPSHVSCSITARQWDTVAVWSWDVQAKTCAICKVSLADECISCQAQGPQTHHGSNGSSSSTTGGGGVGTAAAAPLVASAASSASVSAPRAAPAVSAGSSGAASPATTAAAGAARRGAPASSLPPSAGTTTTTTTAAVSAKHSAPATLADLQDKCCVAWGSCGHVFHYHCVSRWLQMRSMCPVCGRQWQLHKITSNE